MAAERAGDEMWSRVPLVVVLGATGTGKSKLAVELAKRLAGEVIGADSMQVYKGLDIVTNKVSAEEMAEVPHHLIDILSPLDQFNIVDYRNLALAKINEIHSKQKLPIVVGGTNYYIESLLWKVLVQYDCNAAAPAALNAVAADKSATLELAKLPSDELMRRLEAVDPDTAFKLHPNDRRKILRSLEVIAQEGRPLSEVLKEQKSAEGSSCIGGPLRFPKCVIFWLQWDQGVLDEDLDKRVDEMLAKGLLQELLDFHAAYNAERLSREAEPDYTKGIFQCIGFKEFHPYLVMSEAERETEEGRKLFKDSVLAMKMATRRYARRQVKWVNARFLSKINRMTPKLVPLTLSDLSHWEAEILEPATASVQKMLDGEMVVATPSEQLSQQHIVREANKSEPCREFCEVCERLFVLRDQWEIHIKSNRHKRKLASKAKFEQKKRLRTESKDQPTVANAD